MRYDAFLSFFFFFNNFVIRLVRTMPSEYVSATLTPIFVLFLFFVVDPKYFVLIIHKLCSYFHFFYVEKDLEPKIKPKNQVNR